MSIHDPYPYKVTQLGPPNARGEQKNIDVSDLDSLVTHHPNANRNAALVKGHTVGVESPEKRTHAFIGGEFQEVEMLRSDEYRSLKPDHVLLIKDFVLDDTTKTNSRAVDVPAPIAGYIGRVDERRRRRSDIFKLATSPTSRRTLCAPSNARQSWLGFFSLRRIVT